MTEVATEPAAVETAQPPPVVDAAKELLGGSLAAAMPEVDLAVVGRQPQTEEPEKPAEKQQEAPAPAAAPAPAKSRSRTAHIDAKGRPFNPLLHETNEHGGPVFRTGTQILRCRRVPLKELKTTSTVQLDPEPSAGDDQPQTGSTPGVEPAQDPAKAKLQQEAAAATMAGLQVQLMRIALGPQTAEDETERAALTECWLDTFKHYGVGSFHPLMGLTVVTGMVIVKAINKPEGRSRWARLMLWTRLKVGGVWYWLTGRKAKPARPDEPARPVEPINPSDPNVQP